MLAQPSGDKVMPRFKIGDQVQIPANQEDIEPPYKGAKGAVDKVYAGTGFGGKTPDKDGKLTEWSIPHRYLVDFGKPLGKQTIDEHLLEPVT